jgi:hypothetical protein
MPDGVDHGEDGKGECQRDPAKVREGEREVAARNVAERGDRARSDPHQERRADHFCHELLTHRWVLIYSHCSLLSRIT